MLSQLFGSHEKMTFEEIEPDDMGRFPESPWEYSLPHHSPAAPLSPVLLSESRGPGTFSSCRALLTRPPPAAALRTAPFSLAFRAGLWAVRLRTHSWSPHSGVRWNLGCCRTAGWDSGPNLRGSSDGQGLGSLLREGKDRVGPAPCIPALAHRRCSRNICGRKARGYPSTLGKFGED